MWHTFVFTTSVCRSPAEETHSHVVNICVCYVCVSLFRERDTYRCVTRVGLLCLCVALSRKRHIDVARVCVYYVCVSLSHERDTYTRGEHLCMLRLCVFFSNVLAHITLGWHNSMKNGIQTQQQWYDRFHCKCYTSKSTKSRNSHFSAQLQIKPKSQSKFVSWDTEESEFFDLVDFAGVAFWVKMSFVRRGMHMYVHHIRVCICVCVCVCVSL